MTHALTEDAGGFDPAALSGGAVIDLRPRFDVRLAFGVLNGGGSVTAGEHVVFLLNRGGAEGAISLGGPELRWGRGDMLVLATGERAHIRDTAPVDVVSLHIGERLVRECWSPLFGRPSGWRAPVTGVHAAPAAILAHVEGVAAVLFGIDEARTSCRTAIVLGLAEVLACEPIFTQCAEVVTSFARSAVDRALQAIEVDPAQEWTLSRVADVAGVSPYHMSRLFRAAVGCGLQGHLRALRVKRACKLLAETRESLVNIAIDSGFSSQSRMTTVFRAQLGVTPLAYRQQMWGQSAVSAE